MIYCDTLLSPSVQNLIPNAFLYSLYSYPVGIYSDLKLIKSLKKKYGDDSGSKINKQLSRDFSDSKSARTLLLRFHREVAASDIADALGDALINKVGKGTSNKFSTFVLDMVGGDKLTKGSDLYITCKSEKLWSSTTGTDAKTISIKGLCSAIFDVYLGDSPVSQQAKEGFEQGFADMIV